MASILNKYENIMATNVCGIIERAEDPIRMARHLANNLEDDLSRTRREGNDLIVEIESLEADLSIPNAEALLAAKKLKLMRLLEIHEKLVEQVYQITEIRARIYQTQ